MFSFLFKPKSPEDIAKSLVKSLNAQADDCANDIRVMWKKKNPMSLFPHTMAALGSIQRFLDQELGLVCSSSSSAGSEHLQQMTAYDSGAIESLINSHLAHFRKIIDKHKKQCTDTPEILSEFLLRINPLINELQSSLKKDIG